MKEFVKQILKPTPLYRPLRNWYVKQRQAKRLAEWERMGRPVPPPHIVKERALRSYSTTHSLSIFVETGTYFGDMVEAMEAEFDLVFSIELGDDLYENARKRFEDRQHVHIIHGDSGTRLGSLMNKIDQPALFWLDGHYSAGVTAMGEKPTPICEELGHILSAEDHGHVIVIDDARLFGTDPAYPTIDTVRDLVRSKRTNVEIVVQDDMIRIVPHTQPRSLSSETVSV